MKNFLEAWLAELATLATSELGVPAAIEPLSGLPPGGRLLALDIRHGEAQRLLVAVDAAALAALLVAAQVTSAEPDEERDRELWAGMLRQASARAAQALAAQALAPQLETRVQPVEMRAASLEWRTLRAGDSRVPLGVRVESPAQSAGTQRAANSEERQEQRAGPAAAGRPESGQRGEPAQKTEQKTEQKNRSGSFSSQGLDLLLDVELEASLRFGSREMPLNEVLELGAGDVVELERHVSDPVDLLVGDRIVARGEVVLVNGCFGLRVTEVAEPKMRLESIRCLF